MKFNILTPYLVLSALFNAIVMVGKEAEQQTHRRFEQLSTYHKTVATAAMGSVNAIIGTPFQHLKNCLQNKDPFPPVKHLWRGTGVNTLRSTPSTLPEVLIMGNADRIIQHAQLPIAYDTQKAGLAFGCAVPGTVINTLAEQLVLRSRDGNSCASIVKNIVNTAGPLALFRGLTPKIFRDGTGSLSYWYGAPRIKKEYKKQGLSEPFATMAAGITVAIPSAIVTHPFDTISTAMQHDLEKRRYRFTIPSMIKYTNTHDIRSLWRGVIPRTASACLRIPALAGTQEYMTQYLSTSNTQGNS